MTLLTEAFAALDAGGRCVVAVLARRQPVPADAFGPTQDGGSAALIAQNPKLEGKTAIAETDAYKDDWQ